MRLGRLFPATMATAVLLMLAPAAALAHKHPSGRCRVSVNAPREITAGDPVVIFGRLVCHPGGREADQVVKLYHHLAAFPGFTYVQSTTTDAHGFYEFARADGVVETNRAWYVRSHGAQSASKRIKVAAQVTLSGPAEGTQLLTGAANKVTFTGTVTPADVGARVVLQRQNATTGSEWRRIDVGRVEAGGGFTIVHTFRFPGDANIRVLVHSQRRNIPSSSSPLEYDISQAQNAALTILASADPIPYGQSVTITGVLAGMGAVNQPVKLMARTHDQAWAAIAEATSDANGNYAFPAQSPVSSTFYKVATAKPSCSLTLPNKACKALRNNGQVTSAVLYEGVKNMLTAQVSATTVEAGQPLTFSGGVAPSHPGHAIYLERQNASGEGFHVVQSGVVNPDSTYSLVHTVYDAGEKVFRIYIPGGPDNVGAASQQFTIQVTPAPAAVLMPEASSNTSLPPEGSEGNGERREDSVEGSEGRS